MMQKNGMDRIPSREECDELMAKYSMLPNIVEHSLQVMRVALVITDNLKHNVSISRDLVIAGSLLHDITKTRSLQTRERHDASGGKLLRDLGFPVIAVIVEQHVRFRNFNPEGGLEEWEIVYYADKRVMHDAIVTVDERMQDLIHRYGATAEIENLIRQNASQVRMVERKITGFMKMDIDRALQGITAR
jgi:uncharacterized protein